MSDGEERPALVSVLTEQSNTLRGNLNLCEAARRALESDNRLLLARVASLERIISDLPRHDYAIDAATRKIKEQDHELAHRRIYSERLTKAFADAKEKLDEALQMVKALKARVAPIDAAERAKDTAKRNGEIWSRRMAGATYREIALHMGLTTERVRQIAVKTENQIARATNVYTGKVLNPVVYGVWHEFTHDGRVGLS